MAHTHSYTLSSLLTELESLGTEQNRKIYARHVSSRQFGVSWAHLTRLQKAIKCDHDLALKLWETGNSDARCLAPQIADPKLMDKATLERWMTEAGYQMPVNTIAKHLACKTPFALEFALKWLDSPRDLTSAAGWVILVHLAEQNPAKGGTPDATFAPLLERIETTIHQAPNKTKEMMNLALIAIGGYRISLREQALAAARRIGKVDVDHGDTSCKTPDAGEYIMKMAARQKT